MKKVSALVLILIIFNFICSGYITYATNDPNTPSNGQTTPADPADQDNQDDPNSTEADATSENDGSSMTLEEYKSIFDEGTSSVGGNKQKVSLSDSDVGSASSKVGGFFSTVAGTFIKVISELTADGGFYYTESDYSASKTGIFTINSSIFGEYLMFNPKVYQKSTDLNPDITPSETTEKIDGLKERSVEVSKVMSRVALMFSAPLALYALVRILVSKRASDLAAWRKVFARWVLCVFLIVFFQYILITIDTATDVMVDNFWKIRVQLEEQGYTSFEATAEDELIHQLDNTGGVTFLAYAIEFLAIIIVQILFLIKYVIRMLGIILLFILAPIIILLHSINLMIGRESDALGDFFKSYIMLSFMQPFHALFYLIFFVSLSEIAINVPVLGIILLYALYRAENIAKAMFGWEFSTSIFSK